MSAPDATVAYGVALWAASGLTEAPSGPNREREFPFALLPPSCHNVTVHPVRRTPVQERSNDTVQQIFAATSALLSKMPLEQITTSRIAAEARVSIGGLYRFFPDKQAIVDAIAVRGVEEFRESLERRLEETGPVDPREFMDLVIDAYVAFLDARPDFRTIALGRHISATTRETQVASDAGPAALVKSFISSLGIEESPDLDLKIRIATETGDRLIGFAYSQATVAARAHVIAEMKQLLKAYLFG
jgi:AcrR family transcriptional regulator